MTTLADNIAARGVLERAQATLLCPRETWGEWRRI